MNLRFNHISYSSFVTCLVFLSLLSSIYAQQCNQTSPIDRFNCYPEDNPTEVTCRARGCCWQPLLEQSDLLRPHDLDVPSCFYPPDFPTYEVMSSQATDFGQRFLIHKTPSNYLAPNISNLTVDLIYETQQRFRIQIYDTAYRRYQVPLQVPTVQKKANETDYEVDIIPKPFAIIVTRKSTNATLFNSSVSPLMFADQFIRISTQLSSPYLYGLGEHKHPLLINVTESWQRFTFWAHDFPPIEAINLYGVHPFHLNLELNDSDSDQTNVHGQFFLNSNAMEIDLQPLPALTYTTIGGIIDLYIFTGPTVQNVIEQYWAVIGRPMLPPFWSLGFHLSRYGYSNIKNLRTVIQRMHDADFPYDVQWTDIDAMLSNLDFTYDDENFDSLPELVHALQSGGQHYVNVMDAGISSTQPIDSYPPYDEGMKLKIFTRKYQSNDPIIGKIEAGLVAYPDFTNPDAEKWWLEMAQDFHEIIPFDGVCLSMNEPSNFVDGSIDGCTSSILDNPPYTPHVFGNSLISTSLCPSARQHFSAHYNVHSMYGYFEAKGVNQALTTILNKRPFVLSRSTFAGSGHYAAHWTGDNRATFSDMYFSIPDILSFNLFGVTHVGADICGFGLDTTDELCTRWMQLGAFYPFMRNHNNKGQIDQDPASFPWETQQIMKQALLMRYSLIPYWYTLHYEATTKSTTVVQPLFFEYINDENTYNIDRQFLVGSAILVSPVLDANATNVYAYIPDDTWYDFSSGAELRMRGFVNLTAPIQKINVHIRGGFIIPMQIPGPSLILGRGNPFQLLVALSSSGSASGNLYWDDGDSVDSIDKKNYNYFEFTATNSNTLTINPLLTNYKDSTMRLDIIKILGVTHPVTTVTLNGNPYDNFVYNFLDEVLLIHGLDIDLLDVPNQTIVWKTSD